MPFAAASSSHPVPAYAVGEVIGRILEVGGTGPDVALLFVDSAFAGALDDIVATVTALLRPVVLAGCTSSSVLGGGVALWAGYGFDADRDERGPIRLRGPLLVVDGSVERGGAIAVALDAPLDVVTIHACRPVGGSMVVTDSLGDLVLALDGEPANARLQRVLDAIDPDDAVLARTGVLLGDGPALRRIRDIDRRSGALSLDGPVGPTVQLHVRDPDRSQDALGRALRGRVFDSAVVLGAEDLLPAAGILDEWTASVTGAAQPDTSTLSVVLLCEP